MQPIAQQLLDAVTAHNYVLASVSLLILSVWGVRKVAPMLHGQIGAWLNSDRGGAALVILGSGAGALSSALLAGAHISLSLLLKCFVVASSASGTRSLYKSLRYPKKVATKAADTVTAVSPPEPPKAAALIPFLFFTLIAVTASGCPWGKCELAKLPQTAISAVACVSAALAGGTSEDAVTGDIQACGPLAKGQLDCAVAALTTNAENTVATKYKGTAAPANVLRYISRGKAWLSKHPSACYQMSKDKLVQRMSVIR